MKKTPSQFTIFVTSSKEDRTRSLSVSKKTLYLASWGLGLLGVFIVSFLFSYSNLFFKAYENQNLKEKNVSLNNRLLNLETQVVDLEKNLQKVKALSQKIKTLTSSISQPEILKTSFDESSLFHGSSYHSSSGKTGEDLLFDNWEGSELEVRISKILEKTKLEQVKQTELLEDLSEQETLLASLPSMSPVKGWLSSIFGYRNHPITGQPHFHSGIDIASGFGEDVVAPASGVVSFTGYDSGYGKVFFIDHGYGVQTRYAHLSDIFVKLGDRVKRGYVLATVGSTGQSTGPHLHYEIRLHGVSVNPMSYILDLPVQSQVVYHNNKDQKLPQDIN